MGSGGCAEVTLVTLVAVQGVVIGQNVATELQRVDSFNYSGLLKRRFNLIEFHFFLKITCFSFILSVLVTLSGFNFSLISVTCFTAEYFAVEFYLDSRLENMFVFFVIFNSLAFYEGSALNVLSYLFIFRSLCNFGI